MVKSTRRGAEEARNQLPDLLAAAEKGRSTVITRHGRPVAAIVPMSGSSLLCRSRGPAPDCGVKIAREPCANCVMNGAARSVWSARASLALD
jgi:prevent-host-death family protein